MDWREDWRPSGEKWQATYLLPDDIIALADDVSNSSKLQGKRSPPS